MLKVVSKNSKAFNKGSFTSVSLLYEIQKEAKEILYMVFLRSLIIV